MANLTPQQWASKLDSKFKELENAMLLSISGVLSKYVPRIFERGLNSNGTFIGQYSTKPLYVNPKNTVRKSFALTGKTGRNTFKNGKAHKSRYFSGGYKEFKVLIGQGSKVNLRLNEDLMGDMATQQVNKVSKGYDYVIKRDINADKVNWLESHFKTKIFDFSKSENRQLIKNVQAETIRILNK